MQQAEDKGLCKGSSEQHSDINKGKQLGNRLSDCVWLMWKCGLG